MYYSLSDLRSRINKLIAEQGEDAPCAAFIFTKNDAGDEPSDYDGTDLDEVATIPLTDDDVDVALTELGDNQYIYNVINGCIGDALRHIRVKQLIKKNSNQ